jgi:hypothetical protein
MTKSHKTTILENLTLYLLSLRYNIFRSKNLYTYRIQYCDFKDIFKMFNSSKGSKSGLHGA